MSQNALRKYYKYHVLSMGKDDKGVLQCQTLVRKTFYSDNISINDPKPRCCHSHKAIVSIVMIDNKLVSLFLCDYGYYYREHHVCRRVCCVHDEMPVIEHFFCHAPRTCAKIRNTPK